MVSDCLSAASLKTYCCRHISGVSLAVHIYIYLNFIYILLVYHQLHCQYTLLLVIIAIFISSRTKNFSRWPLHYICAMLKKPEDTTSYCSVVPVSLLKLLPKGLLLFGNKAVSLVIKSFSQHLNTQDLLYSFHFSDILLCFLNYSLLFFFLLNLK